MMEENDKQSYQLEDTEDFGLSQQEYEPIEREEDDIPQDFHEPVYHEEEEEEENNREGLIIAAIIGFLVIIGLAVYLFGFGGKEQVASWFGEDTEQPQLAPSTDIESEATIEPEPEPLPTYEEPASDPVAEEVIPETTGAYSSIETITIPTGRSYVVIGSFVDEDLARDLGNQLMETGTGIRILSPTERAPLMHRVAVADFDTFEEASSGIDEYVLTYGDAWVLKY